MKALKPRELEGLYLHAVGCFADHLDLTVNIPVKAGPTSRFRSILEICVNGRKSQS